MRTRYFTLALLILLIMTSCDKQEREQRKKLKPIAKESMETFTSMVDAIDWKAHNPPGPDLNDEANEPCFQSLITQYGQLPNIDIDKRRFDEIIKVFEFSRLVQKPVDEGKFKNIEGADNEYLAHPIRDRILTKIDAGYSKEEFADEVKGNGDLSDTEVDELKEMLQKFNEVIKNKRYILNSGTQDLGHCSFSEHMSIRFNSIDTGQKEIVFIVKRQVIFLCKCLEEMGQNDPRYGYIQFESELKASYEENGLYKLVFTGTSTPNIASLHIVCCRNNNQETEEEENEDENH